MKNLAIALGVEEGASEEALLAALNSSFVPKAIHDEALKELRSARLQILDVGKAGFEKKVADLVDGAVKAFKITPAQRDHYISLCSSETAYESVASLIGALAPFHIAKNSGLDALAPDATPYHRLTKTECRVAENMGLPVEDFGSFVSHPDKSE